MTKSLVKQKDQEIRYRDRIITVLFLFLAGLVIAYFRIPDTIEIHRLPDANRLLTHKVDYIPKSSVYSFARLALETIYTCGKDCYTDIPANVDALRAYISESCRSEIKTRVSTEPNLYRNRTRALTYLFNPTTQGYTQFSGESPIGRPELNVEKASHGGWNVALSYNFKENVGGYETINTEIYYPIRIMPSDLPKNINEYQLTFDCFYGEVVRKSEEVQQ